MSVGRFAGYAALAVLGVLTGIAGAVVQAGWFPGGLLLALLGIGALCYGGGKVTGTRVGAGAPAGGWLLAVLLLTTARPEGDFLFGAGPGSYIFMLGGMLIAVICATVPSLPPPAPHTPRLGE